MQILPTAPDVPTTKGPAERFSGDVWFDVLAAPPSPSRLQCAVVRFAPGAHTNWHRHAAGQTLHVLEGIARVGTRDGRIVELSAGRTVWTPPGEWHFHGAAPGTFMSHLALSEAADEAVTGYQTEWAEPVDPELFETMGVER